MSNSISNSNSDSINSSSPAKAQGTRLVEVRLSALTRVEYTEVVEVPADISDAELGQLVDQRYAAVDGGEFTPDSEYWERGTCYAAAAEPGDVPTKSAFRTEHGWHVEAAMAKG